MSKPLAPILTTSDLARRLGAVPVPIVTGGADHLGVLAFLRLRACDAIAAAGREIPILSRDGGPVYAWPVQPGARDSGAGR